jgi:exodeoxyribonuclease-3
MSNSLLRVATYNVNGVRARLESLLAWLQSRSPDIVCLQETKVQDEEFPAEPLRAAGWHVIFRGQKAHAGVAIISREEPVEVAHGFDDGGEPDEPRLLRAVIRDIPVVNTYVPQGRSIDSEHFLYKLQWFDRLRSFFDRHCSPQEPLLWAGDFNVAPDPIDVYAPDRLKKHVDFHPDARARLEQVREWGFVDLFRMHHPGEPDHYTYWDYRVRNALGRGMGWRIDHIWASQALAPHCTRAWIDVEARRAQRPSDHTFLVAEFSL